MQNKQCFSKPSGYVLGVRGREGPPSLPVAGKPLLGLHGLHQPTNEKAYEV